MGQSDEHALVTSSMSGVETVFADDVRVEQPVGTGFSVGEIFATSQEQTAQDFIGFFKNFEKLFGIKNFKIYVTGESYAGRYVPYISAAMLDQNDTEYFDLSGRLPLPYRA